MLHLDQSATKCKCDRFCEPRPVDICNNSETKKGGVASCNNFIPLSALTAAETCTKIASTITRLGVVEQNTHPSSKNRQREEHFIARVRFGLHVYIEYYLLIFESLNKSIISWRCRRVVKGCLY